MSGPDNDSKLNADLVLRRAFDVASGKLKVDAEVTATIGNVDVVIDAASGDNIAISDGTDVMAVNADGSINIDKSTLATTAKQDTGNSSLASIDAKLTEVSYKTIIDQASGSVTYVGRALAGTATSAAAWQVSKFEQIATQLIETTADGDFLLNNIWDNRASLTYS